MPCHSRGIGKRETQLLKFAAIRPYSDPEKASRRLMEHAQAFETVQDGGLHRENQRPFICSATRQRPRNTPPALSLRSRGSLKLHESGTFVVITQGGADMFA